MKWTRFQRVFAQGDLEATVRLGEQILADRDGAAVPYDCVRSMVDFARALAGEGALFPEYEPQRLLTGCCSGRGKDGAPPCLLPVLGILRFAETERQDLLKTAFAVCDLALTTVETTNKTDLIREETSYYGLLFRCYVLLLEKRRAEARRLSQLVLRHLKSTAESPKRLQLILEFSNLHDALAESS